jgi:tripartite-type tricarboxylate transporter receptor subunit TctC
MTELKRKTLAAALVLMCVQVHAASSAGADAASSYPNKPIRLVVPSAPGGGTDIIARLIGQGLSEAWGQTVVVDNRGGAGGIPGVTTVAKHSAADGYTMLLGSNGHLSFAPAVRPNLPFNPQKDLATVSMVATQPFVWVVSPAVPVNSMKDFVAYAKGKPGALRYGSGGVGTASHLGTELLQLSGGIKLDHVPYKGTGPGMTAILAGEIQCLLVGLSTVLPYVKAKSDKLKVLAVTSPKRAAVAPDIPTIAESALPGYEFNVWYGMVVPGGTPRAIVTKANAEIVRLLNAPAIRARFTALGIEPSPSTPEGFRDILKREIPIWHKVAKQANIRIE